MENIEVFVYVTNTLVVTNDSNKFTYLPLSDFTVVDITMEKYPTVYNLT